MAPFQASRSVSRVPRVSYHGNHRTGAHVLHQRREEWFVLQVNVVFRQQFSAGLQQETGDRRQFDKGFVQVPQKLRARISGATCGNPTYTAFMQPIVTPTFLVGLSWRSRLKLVARNKQTKLPDAFLDVTSGDSLSNQSGNSQE